MDTRLINDLFPRSNKYNPDWVVASVSGGANPLWLAEWLSSVMHFEPGMRVLDLGCGRAMSSFFLRREFGVEVWATDLCFSASENLKRIRDAGVGDGVYPLHADARSLPYALKAWWEPNMCCFHSAAWWRRHWERTKAITSAAYAQSAATSRK